MAVSLQGIFPSVFIRGEGSERKTTGHSFCYAKPRSLQQMGAAIGKPPPG